MPKRRNCPKVIVTREWQQQVQTARRKQGITWRLLAESIEVSTTRQGIHNLMKPSAINKTASQIAYQVSEYLGLVHVASVSRSRPRRPSPPPPESDARAVVAEDQLAAKGKIP